MERQRTLVMPTVVYRNYGSTVTVATNNLMFADAVRDGTLLGVRVYGFIEAAAGTTVFDAEASVNTGTTVNYNANNPDRTGIIATLHSAAINATLANFDTGFVPCNCPLKTGDKMNINYMSSVTAPTRVRIGADWTVEE